MKKTNTINSKIGEIKLEYNYDSMHIFNEIKLIDVSNNQEIGYINFKFYNEPYKYVWLNKIEVYKNYQSMGFGKFLLKCFEKFCIKNQYYNIEGKYYPENEFAKPLYIKNGYKIIKEYYETLLVKTLDKNNKINSGVIEK